MALNIQKAYDYAKLVKLVYIDLSTQTKDSLKEAKTIIEVSSTVDTPRKTVRIPEFLGTQTLMPHNKVSVDVTRQWTALNSYFKIDPISTSIGQQARKSAEFH